MAEEQVKDYDVVSERSVDNLIAAVKRAISLGWQPQGGMQLVMMSDGPHLYQALVKR